MVQIQVQQLMSGVADRYLTDRQTEPILLTGRRPVNGESFTTLSDYVTGV